MTAYNVYLGNPTRMPFGNSSCTLYSWQDLVDAVHALFLNVTGHSNAFNEVIVRPTMQAPQNIGVTDLLIYVLPSYSHSVIRANRNLFHDNVIQSMQSSNEGGTTRTRSDNLTCSEVYVNDLSKQALAHLIYHEAMHNKLRMTNRQLHRRRGLAGETITEETHQLGRNSRLMANNLGVTVPQWLGGFQNVRLWQPDIICELYGG